jgi:hypothetical protein
MKEFKRILLLAFLAVGSSLALAVLTGHLEMNSPLLEELGGIGSHL